MPIGHHSPLVAFSIYTVLYNHHLCQVPKHFCDPEENSVHDKSLESCPYATLWTCSPPGFSVHGILQARILEWVVMPSSRGSAQPRNRTQVSCIAGGFFTAELQGKPSRPRDGIKTERRPCPCGVYILDRGNQQKTHMNPMVWLKCSVGERGAGSGTLSLVRSQSFKIEVKFI